MQPLLDDDDAFGGRVVTILGVEFTRSEADALQAAMAPVAHRQAFVKLMEGMSFQALQAPFVCVAAAATQDLLHASRGAVNVLTELQDLPERIEEGIRDFTVGTDNPA